MSEAKSKTLRGLLIGWVVVGVYCLAVALGPQAVLSGSKATEFAKPAVLVASAD